MRRFPVLQAYHTFLQLLAFILMLAGLIAAIFASQTASNLYVQGSPDYHALNDLLLKAAVFTAVYAAAMLIACIPLVIAEGLALRLSMEAHLFDLRHRDPAPVYASVQQTNRIQQKISQQMASLMTGWRSAADNTNGTARPITEASRPARLRTGKTGNLPAASKPVTGPLKREVLPGKPKTAPLRPPELRIEPLVDEETAPVEEASILPESTIRTQEMVALSKQSKTLRNPTASYNFRKAVEHFEAENFSGAIDFLDKALEVDAGYANAYRLRAACYRRTGNAEHARRDLALYMQYVAEKIPQG